MKNIILSFIMFALNISCKSQIISLEQAVIYKQQTGTIPQNTTYIKDINHSLDKYIGIWRGNYNGKSYEFKFIKKENIGENLKWDKLIGKLQIKDSNGTVIYNNFNESDNEISSLSGYNFQSNLKAYMVYFVGNSIGCAEYGFIYLFMKPNIPNEMNISLLPDNDIVKEGKCPVNFQPVIPYKKTITLIKQ